MAGAVKMIPPEQARLDSLLEMNIAVLGYGSQGAAHALNLRDSGCRVIVAQRKGGARFEAAVNDGFDPISLAEAVPAADMLIFGLPDDAVSTIYPSEIEPHVRAGQTFGFMHGFVMHYRQIAPPADVDVIMVAPKAQGRGVRSEFVAGRGAPALIAIGQDATGHARETATSWAAGIGADRAGMVETTFKDETETDLFGEQAVLCGGMTALIKAGFETLVEAGYPPELAYFECCHEIKLLADLVNEGGLTHMRKRISSTARFGDLTRGPRLATDALRREMRQMLNEIRDGSFTCEFLQDSAAGGTTADELLQRDAEHPLEAVGRRMRQMMWGADVKQ